MRLRGWPTLALSSAGGTWMVPPVCPNCLAPGTESRRVKYHEGLGTQTWKANILYCDACAGTLDAYARWRRKVRIFLMLWAVVAVFPAFLLVAGLTPEQAPALFPGLLAVAAAGVSWYARRAKAALRRQWPLKPAQAVWGPAAFYVGTKGWRKPSCVFRAARREWLQAVIDGNPGPTGQFQ